MKPILAVAILLGSINAAEAQAEPGKAADQPIATGHLMALYACEETVIKANFSPQNDEKSIWPLIKKGCAKQIQAAKDTCRHESNSDDCGTDIDNLLSSHYTDAVITIMREKE